MRCEPARRGDEKWRRDAKWGASGSEGEADEEDAGEAKGDEDNNGDETRASAPASTVPAACPDTVLPFAAADGARHRRGDGGATFATLYYMYVTNGVQYAWHKGYVPYIAFNSTWMQQTMGAAAADAPPLWEHFFRSYCPGVGPWLARCSTSSPCARRSGGGGCKECTARSSGQ